MVRPASAEAEKPKPLKEEVASCSWKIRFGETNMIAYVFGLLWHCLLASSVKRCRLFQCEKPTPRKQVRQGRLFRDAHCLQASSATASRLSRSPVFVCPISFAPPASGVPLDAVAFGSGLNEDSNSCLHEHLATSSHGVFGAAHIVGFVAGGEGIGLGVGLVAAYFISSPLTQNHPVPLPSSSATAGRSD